MPKLYNSSFSGLISSNDDIHRTVTDCFNLLSSPNPDYLIESWAALRNGTCSDVKKVVSNCDKGFTHDNNTGLCYKVIEKSRSFYDIESYSDVCQKFGADFLFFDSDQQIQSLLKLLRQGKIKF